MVKNPATPQWFDVFLFRSWCLLRHEVLPVHSFIRQLFSSLGDAYVTVLGAVSQDPVSCPVLHSLPRGGWAEASSLSSCQSAGSVTPTALSTTSCPDLKCRFCSQKPVRKASKVSKSTLRAWQRGWGRRLVWYLCSLLDRKQASSLHPDHQKSKICLD